MHPTLRCLGRLVVVASFAVASASAQQQPQESSPPIAKPAWSLTGDLGAVGELYSISGRENRRPNQTGRMFFRPTFTLADRYTIRSEFLLSTEGSSALARQSINQYLVNPSWKWSQTRYSARIGDFSDAYTPTTFNGVQVRGGGLAVQRERAHAAILGGRTKPATEGGADGGSFRQALFAGQAGVGDARRSLSAFVLYAADDGGSLPVLPDTAGAIDSTEVGTAVNPYSVTPQKNFVVATWGQSTLLDNRLSLAAEVGRSSYTRDRRAADAGGGRVDYALDTKARYVRKRYELTGGYRRIGPGFVSLGVASMHADQQDLTSGGILRIGTSGALRAQVSRQNDNLSRQKAATTVRYRYVSTLNLRPTRLWTATISGNYVTMANHLADDSARVDFSAWILGMNHAIALGHRSLVQSLSFGYTAQGSGDDNPLRRNSDALSHTGQVQAMVRVLRNLSAAPAIGIASVQTGLQAWRTTMTYGLAVQHRGMGQRLTSSLSGTASTAAGDENIPATLGSRYTMTRSDALELRVAFNRFRGAARPTAGETNYEESTSSFGWSHRF